MLTGATPWLSPTDKTKMILQFICKPQIPDLLHSGRALAGSVD